MQAIIISIDKFQAIKCTTKDRNFISLLVSPNNLIQHTFTKKYNKEYKLTMNKVCTQIKPGGIYVVFANTSNFK